MRESSKNKKIKLYLEKIKSQVSQFNNPLALEFWAYAVEQYLDHQNTRYIEFLGNLEQFPVSIEEFLESDQFIGALDSEIWDSTRESLIEMHSNWWRGTEGGAYIEAIFDGGTGTAKSYRTIISFAYWAHILMCMKNPQKFWGLSKEKPIVMAIMGSKPHVVKRVIYQPIRKLIDNMPWFQEYARPVKHIESCIYFSDKNIYLTPAGTEDDSIIGEDVIAGAIDEINFMNVIQKSKKAAQTGGRNATYDQAESLYSALVSRRQGRFAAPGPQIGMIVLSSSARYVNDFTDRRIKKACSDPDPAYPVYIHAKAQYEMIPKWKLDKNTFRVLLGEQNGVSRILEPDEWAPEDSRVLEIPYSNYYALFKADISRGLRDICGIRENSVDRFIKKLSTVNSAIERWKRSGNKQLVDRQNVVLAHDGMPSMLSGATCVDRTAPRYIHVDLSKSGCRCGIAMCRYDGLVHVRRANGAIEALPKATIELAVSIEPDDDNNIDLFSVRNFIKSLKHDWGYPIVCVSYDQWNSLESRQQLRKAGIPTKELSVDKPSSRYKQFREGLYDDRIDLPENEILIDELFNLEYDEVKDKIDHKPDKEKDVADAACGAYNLMLMRSSTFEDPTVTERPETQRPETHRRSLTRRPTTRRR